MARRLSIRLRRLSHVRPSGVIGFVPFLDTEGALLRELILIFFLFLRLLHSVLILLVFFFSVTLLFFLTFLRIFGVVLLQDFWVQLILLFNNFLHSHDVVVPNGVAKDFSWAGAYF